jgi:phosphotriesterase-related protein
MKESGMEGKALTVLGPVDPESLGTVLTHEHILMDITALFSEPEEATEKRMAYETVSMENLQWIYTHMMRNKDDLLMRDEELAIEELMRFKKVGGDTVVEVSCNGLGRDPAGLKRVARATGLHLVMGAGYYIGCSQPECVDKKSEDVIADDIVKDIMVGVGDTGVRCGIIGEVGCSMPLEECERKSLKASAIAQKKTGAAINIHPSRSDELLLESVDILEKSGADLDRVIISHAHHFGFKKDTLIKLMKAGCYMSFDTFGHPALPVECFTQEERLLEMPSDVQRIYYLREFINEGFLEKILISQDCCFKHKYVKYGGFGYAHIIEHIIPWMKQREITAEQIHTITVENPKRVLTFVRSKE